MEKFFANLKNNIDVKDILIFFIPVIIFTVVLFSYWPGIMTYDGNYQCNQIKNGYISDSHPFLSTLVPLILFKIWNQPTILYIVHILIFSIIWCLLCKEIRKNYNEKLKQFKFQIIYTIFVCVMPIIFMYVITFWKDVLYSYGLLMLVFYIYKGIRKNFKYSAFDLIILALTLIFVQLYRHNGLVVTLIMVPTFIYMFVKRGYAKKLLIIFIVSLIIFEALVQIPKAIMIKPALDIMDNKYALPLFITGALLHAEVDMEEEDLEYLDSIFPLEEWKNSYCAYLINPISSNKLVNRQRMEETYPTLLKVFLKYSLKNPHIVIFHYLRVTSMLWSPYPFGYSYIFDFSDEYNYNFDEKVDTKFETGKNICDFLIVATMKNGFVKSILYRPAIPMYVAIILIVLLVKRTKNKKYYMLLLPMLLNTLSVLPFSLAQDIRYVYINYLTMFFVIMLYISSLFEKRKMITENIKENE